MRRFGWLLALNLVLALAACGGSSPEKVAIPAKPAATQTPPASSVRVGLSTNRANPFFSDAALRAVRKASTDFGVQSKDLQAETGETDSVRQDRLRQLASAGYNPVIVVGTIYTYALAKVAKEFPGTRFAFVDSSALNQKNVTALVFDEREGAFLAGTIAAQASRTRRVGFIGGSPGPALEAIAAGFEQGARAARPAVKVTRTYVSPDPSGFDDPSRARSVANGMIGAGDDVLYAVAFNSNPGVFQAAAGKRKLAIGMDSDQYLTAAAAQKPAILTSVVKQVDVAVYAMIKSAVDGQMLAGAQTFDVKDGGVSYATSNPAVQPYQALADKFEQELVSGAVRVGH